MITNPVKEVDFTQISEESLAPDLNLNLTLKSCIFQLCRRGPKMFLEFKPGRHRFPGRAAKIHKATSRAPLLSYVRASVTCFRC